MQKRSHKLLASALLQTRRGFGARRYDLAFLFGSVQPDCNPLSYLKGSLRASKFQGHNFPNSRQYIESHILRLQRRKRWTVWQYYTLGKLTHYLADAFTYPHNETFSNTLLEHHNYESTLRKYLADYLAQHSLPQCTPFSCLTKSIRELHRQYLASAAGIHTDVFYILQATKWLMTICPARQTGNAA